MYQTGKTGKAYLYSRGAHFEIGRDSGYRNDVFRDFPDHHHANRGLVPRQRHNSLLPNPFTSSFNNHPITRWYGLRGWRT